MMGLKENERLYPVVEIFSGVMEIARHDGFAFEQRLDTKHNIHTSEGAKLLIKELAKCQPQGLCWIAPTCSSWLAFVSKATSKRTKDYCCYFIFL